MKNIILILYFIGLTSICYSQKKEISEAFYNKDYDRSILLAENILKENPTDIDANLGIAKALNEKSEFQKSIPYLETTLKNATEDWQYSWANIELMKSYFGLSKTQSAKEYFLKASEYKGTKTSSNILKKYSLLFGFDELYKNWKIVETENLIFHFQESIDTNLIEHIIKTRQKAFEIINLFFISTLPKKIDFFVWNTTANYNEYLKSNLGFTIPNYCVSHNKVNQSAGHEVAHNISFWTNKNKTTTRFINEGIGVYFDQNNNVKMQIAKEVFKKNPLQIKELWLNGNNYSDEVLYSIAGAFVEFLIEHNKDRFLKLNENQTYKSANEIYKGEVDTLIAKFTGKLKE